jgi:hypothetical protein
VEKEAKAHLSKIPTKSLHLITDIWTSIQRLSVFGLKAQFIKDWSLHQVVLGFRHFPGTHSGKEIWNHLKRILTEQEIGEHTVHTFFLL